MITKLVTTEAIYKVTKQPGNYVQCNEIKPPSKGEWFEVVTDTEVHFINPAHVVEFVL